MSIDSDIVRLIDKWYICPYSDKVDELFDCLRYCTEAYVTKGILDTKAIISIVKDIRVYINPHGNVNLFHFSDIICDAILLKFEGINEDKLPEFIEFTRECEHHAFFEA
jgi:hypothetical protein